MPCRVIFPFGNHLPLGHPPVYFGVIPRLVRALAFLRLVLKSRKERKHKISKYRSGRAQHAAPPKGNVRLGRNIAFDFYRYDIN
jgi:hypothetical protein